MDPHNDPSNPYTDDMITGFSRSGLATYVHHKEMNVMFDLGFCPVSMVSVPTVFLTHTHLDHSGGVMFWLQVRGLHSMKESKIICPDEAVPAIEKLTVAMDALNFSSKKSYKPTVVPASTTTSMKVGNSTLSVSSFPVDHVVPSVGYKVIRSTKKLRDDLVGASPATIVSARSQIGDGIYNVTERNVFTFIGDSRISTLEKDESILDTDVLMMEATFLDKSDRSDKYGHTSLVDLVEFLKSSKYHPKTLYLKHFHALTAGTKSLKPVRWWLRYRRNS